jgi:glutathione synthase/RimK-type ligase-like ATP-grasp enzyme
VGSGSDPETPRLAIATCAELADLDPEGQLLLARLREAGVAAEPAVWDDPGVAWERFARVLLRSTWDYPVRHEAFAAWSRERGPALINPVELVEWNLSKRYLAQLEDWGFRTVPTRFLAPGDPVEIDERCEFVVKPAISAGSKDAARYRPGEGERATVHARALLGAGREAMVQPYVESVEGEAETAAIVLGGRFSHAIRKSPLLRPGEGFEEGLFRTERVEPREARPAQAALAEEIVARVTDEVRAPLYARVDLLDDSDGEPLVLELELIEPSLFIDHDRGGAERLVELLRAELAP